jgi:hypothetical protein
MLFVAAAGFVSKSADVQVTGRGGGVDCSSNPWRHFCQIGGVDLLIKSLAPFLFEVGIFASQQMFR